MSTHSAIETAAQALVLRELSGQPGSHTFYTTVPQQPAEDEPTRIALHQRAAELYSELIAAAPSVWATNAAADKEEAHHA